MGIINIDRAQSLDPIFMGKNQVISKNSSDVDERSITLTELDLSKVELITMFKQKEEFVRVEERLNRLKKAGHIRLDALIFQTLWNNQNLIPESWKNVVGGKTRFISFDGTVIRHADNFSCVLYIRWDHNKWYWGAHWLDYTLEANCPSAVIFQ